MPNYRDYQESISKELISQKDRVRDFIDNHHHYEDGRYKEIILKEMLRRVLPNYCAVGTGFVVNNDKMTSQIDIIVYDAGYPVMFKKEDFVIVSSASVFGIIEVKSRLRNSDLKNIVRKSNRNGQIIDRTIFNGIFAYEIGVGYSQGVDREAFWPYENGFVNYIALGEDLFVKYWYEGELKNCIEENYAVYELKKLAFGYFISNLVEDVWLCRNKVEELPEELKNMLYPIESGKEEQRKETIKILRL